MNKRITIVASIVVIAIAGLVLAYYQNRQSATTQNQQSEQQTTTPSAPQSTSSEPGQYVAYSPELVASQKGTKILFFHAPWCPQCRQLDNELQNTKLPTGVTFMKVDYDSNQDLRKTYGVTLQTTFIRIADDGSLVEKYVAYNDPTYEALKANILE